MIHYFYKLVSPVERQKMQRQLSKTVMICDDDNDLLQLFGKALKSRYNIILVSSGEDCIDRFIKEKNRGNYIHLILLDYKLGDIFGDSVARKVKEYNEDNSIFCV
jgi:response regulator RpfG family c-di-GMP phosphodiesterase